MNNYSFTRSEQLLERALACIPLGTQTFSKSITQYPRGISPYFIARGDGSRVWDVDGNEYIDFINGLASISLGYNDPDVDAAVKRQIENGVIFSLPHRLEMEVAERIVDMVPCAEMVRYGKNGSDATAGAVRLARAHTGRDHVAVCGYHGWQDWYIGASSRNLGVPRSTRELTHKFAYNEISSLQAVFKRYRDQVAAVVLEPVNLTPPAGDFLGEVRDLTHANGALLVFDEMVTGFRFSLGGAQELYGVTPDLATFGKGLGNGYPISAVVGRKDVMMLMEEIFFSFTFGGEALSLAAAGAVLDKIRREPVLETLETQGRKVMSGVETLIARHDVGDFVRIAGNPVWSFLLIGDAGSFSEWEIKSLFLQEAFNRGILMIGTHVMSYAHSDEDVAYLLSVYDEILPLIGRAVREGTVRRDLRGEVLRPLFKIR